MDESGPGNRSGLMLILATSQITARETRKDSLVNIQRRYQHGSLVQRNGRWIARWYYAPGQQKSRTLGSTERLTEKQARIMLDQIIAPMNLHPEQARRFESVERFVSGVFAPVKIETGQWRHNTSKHSMGEINKHILPEIGAVTFDELRPEHLRSVLRKMVHRGLSNASLAHVRGHLTGICEMAAAEGYLSTNISEGLKLPKLKQETLKSTPSGTPNRTDKLVVSLLGYVGAWRVFAERERLLCDLVLLAGMRPSEAFGLWCGDVGEDRIWICRSWHRGRYEPPKTPKSEREVGPPSDLLNRIHRWIERLLDRGGNAPVFPSLLMETPVSQGNTLKRHIYPKLDAAGIARFSFDTLRRTHSTLHKQLKTDIKVIAAQQGHGLNTHLEEYVQVDVSEKRAESEKLYAKFLEALKIEGN